MKKSFYIIFFILILVYFAIANEKAAIPQQTRNDITSLKESVIIINKTVENIRDIINENKKQALLYIFVSTFIVGLANRFWKFIDWIFKYIFEMIKNKKVG